MRRGLLAAAATAAVLLPVAALGASRDGSFTDPAGDGGAAPDVTRVTVSNTADGRLTVTATFPSHAALDATQFVDVLLDTDRNPNTGGLGLGVDYAFELGASGATTFVKLTGDTSNPNIRRETVQGTYAGGTLTFSVNRSELGNTTALGLLVLGGAVDASGDSLAGLDRAPDNGLFPYELTLPAPAVTLTADAPIPVPGRPLAGKPFSIALPVTRSDTGGPLTGGGKVTCTARAGTTTIQAQGRFAGGLARCTMRVPAAAAGKTLRGTIAVTFRNAGVRRPFTLRIL